jgi:hypothetical protein
LPGVVNVPCFQGETQTLPREIRQMDRYITPKGAIVVPEMVVGVVSTPTRRELQIFNHCVLPVVNARIRGMKKETVATRDGIRF